VKSPIIRLNFALSRRAKHVKQRRNGAVSNFDSLADFRSPSDSSSQLQATLAALHPHSPAAGHSAAPRHIEEYDDAEAAPAKREYEFGEPFVIVPRQANCAV